jgi:hypothetical protein
LATIGLTVTAVLVVKELERHFGEQERERLSLGWTLAGSRLVMETKTARSRRTIPLPGPVHPVS